jgi:hypothetical protein
VVPKISQETLAEMVGTTRSRVSFFMNRFRKLGFIQYRGTQKVGYRFTAHFSTSFSTTSFRAEISKPSSETATSSGFCWIYAG